MSKIVDSLKKDISSHLTDRKSQEAIYFSNNFKEDTNSGDADICLYLFYKEQPLAKMGISYGLSNYYRTTDFCGLDFYENRDPLVLNAVEKARKKWGVSLMQSFPGKKSLRKELSSKNTNYSNLLMCEMNYLSKKFDFPLEFYIPGRLVFWNLNSINNDFSLNFKGFEDILYENYDSVAKRFGFQLSADESLYER